MYLLKSIINFFCDLNYPLIYANNIYKIKVFSLFTWSVRCEPRSAVRFQTDVFQGNFFTFYTFFVITSRIVLGFDK